MSKPFLELLHFALRSQEEFTTVPTKQEWYDLFSIAKKQALVGVCFSGIERLLKEQQPPRELLLQWWGLTQQIEARNERMNEATWKVWDAFAENGLRALILKGQGNALWYPLPNRRQPGDVDVWVTTGEVPYKPDDSRTKVLQWVKQRFPEQRADLKHIHYPMFKDVEVEVHFQPGIMRGFMTNRRLQNFFTQEIDKGEIVKLSTDKNVNRYITVPSWNMNAVYLLVHLFDHFMYEGVGMRQVVDYYYFLKKGYEKIDREYINRTLNSIHLNGFCGAVMWVLHDILGLEKEYLLAKTDHARGQLLLDEIMAGGNFGQFESRYWKPTDSKWKRYWKRTARQLHFFRLYPREVISTPLFLIYQRVMMLKLNK